MEPLSAEVVTSLVNNHREFLGFLERRLGDKVLAEDILQDAFVRGLPKLSEVEQEESVVAWFYRVLRNAVSDHYRRGGASQRKLAAFAAELEQESVAPVERESAVCQCVSRLAETLKPEYARALKRVEVDGVSVKDYASEQGISPNSAGVRIFRAREALRQRVSRSCGTCAEHGCLDCTCAATTGGGCH